MQSANTSLGVFHLQPRTRGIVMNYEAGKLKRAITDQIRASVVEDLPELNQIKDATLRTKAIEAWAHALCESSFQRIRDIPGEGNPGVFTLKRGNQADHLR